MLTVLKWLVFGHLHKWEKDRETPVYLGDGTKERPVGVRVICRCAHCGKFRSFDV